MSAQEHHIASKMAKAVTFMCLKNLMHNSYVAGKEPVSPAGDFTDVFITDGQGNQIAWTECCRLSHDEREKIQTEIICGIYDFLLNVENETYGEAMKEAYRHAVDWKGPESRIRRHR
ncbi:MAG TPA: hypothetical protein DD624_05180 [Alphaproteobacteria bacterium]|nr:hypothetical protein [Alphaproteobacteria bacterium]